MGNNGIVVRSDLKDLVANQTAESSVVARPDLKGSVMDTSSEGNSWDLLGAAGRAVRGLVPSLATKIGGLEQMSGEYQANHLSTIDAELGNPYGGALTPQDVEKAREAGRQKAAYGKALVEGAHPDVLANAPHSWVEGVLGGVVHMAPALLLSAPTMGGSLLADMGLGGAGQKYAELRQQGVDPDTAASSAGVTGGLYAATAFLPLSVLAKPEMVPLKKLVVTSVANAGGMGAAEAGSLLFDKVGGANPGLTLTDALKQVGLAVANGVAQGVVLSGVHGGYDVAKAKLAKARENNTELVNSVAEPGGDVASAHEVADAPVREAEASLTPDEVLLKAKLQENKQPGVDDLISELQKKSAELATEAPSEEDKIAEQARVKAEADKEHRLAEVRADADAEFTEPEPVTQTPQEVSVEKVKPNVEAVQEVKPVEQVVAPAQEVAPVATEAPVATKTPAEKVLDYVAQNPSDFVHGKAPALARLASVAGVKPSEAKAILTEAGKLKDGKFFDAEKAKAAEAPVKAPVSKEITDPSVLEALRDGDKPVVLGQDGTVHIDLDAAKFVNDQSSDHKISADDIWTVVDQIKKENPKARVVLVNTDGEKVVVSKALSSDKSGADRKAFFEAAKALGLSEGGVSSLEEKALLAKTNVRYFKSTTKVGGQDVPTYKVQSFSNGKWTTMNVAAQGKGKRGGALLHVFKNEREAVEFALAIAEKKQSPVLPVLEGVEKATVPVEPIVNVKLETGEVFPFTNMETAKRVAEMNGWKNATFEEVTDTKTPEQGKALEKVEESFKTELQIKQERVSAFKQKYGYETPTIDKVKSLLYDETGAVGDVGKLKSERAKKQEIVDKLTALAKEAEKQGKTLQELFYEKGGTEEQMKKLWEAAGDLYQRKRQKAEGVLPDTKVEHITLIAEKIGLSPKGILEFVERVTGKKVGDAANVKELTPEELNDVYELMKAAYVGVTGKKFSARTSRFKPQPKPEISTTAATKKGLSYWFDRGAEHLMSTEAGRQLRSKLDTIFTKRDLFAGKLTAELHMQHKYIEKHNDRLLLKYLGPEEFWKGVRDEEKESVKAGIELASKAADPAKDQVILASLKTMYDTIGRMMEDRYITVASVLNKKGTLTKALYVHDPNKPYFPHMLDPKDLVDGGQRNRAILKGMMARYGVTENVAKVILAKHMKNMSASKAYGNMEYNRDFDVAGWNRNILDVSTQYAEKGLLRLFSIDEFGKKGQHKNELLSNIQEQGGDVEAATEVIENAVGSGPRGRDWANRLADAGLAYTIITKMGLSAFSNVTQNTNTWAFTDLKTMYRTARALTGKDKNANLQFAYETGAMLGMILKEFRGEVEGRDLPSEFLNKTGFTAVEIFNRTFAAVAGREYALKEFQSLKEAKPGTAQFERAKRNLERVGLTFEPGELLSKAELTGEELRYAGLKMSDKTQFRSNALTLPLWVKPTPLIRSLTLLHTFSYHQATFMKDMFKQDKARFVGSLAGMALVGGVFDEAKRLMRLRRPPQSWIEGATSALAAGGGFGAWFDMAQATAQNKYGLVSYLGGPLAGEVSQFGAAIVGGLIDTGNNLGILTGVTEGNYQTNQYKEAAKLGLGAAPRVLYGLSPTLGVAASMTSGATKNLIFPTKGSLFPPED